MSEATHRIATDVRPLPDLPHYGFIGRIAALSFVDAIMLYGSRARGEARPRSDIDIAVSAPTADPQQWQQVIDIVDDADTLLEIDCVRLDALPTGDSLQRAIEKDGIALFARAVSA